MSEVKLPKVLCVDDEPGLLRSLRWLLRGQYEVAVTDSPRAGLSLLSADEFDVIISDQRMPGMTGTEFLQEAKRLSPRSVRLLLTGYSDFDAVLSSVNDGEVFRFITKPWDNTKLLSTVGEAAKVARMSAASWSDFEDTASQDDAQAAAVATVLVFDTDPELARDIQSVVGSNTRVIWTNDIGDAVGRLSQQDISVLITDVAGMRTQQLDLIRAVRRNQPRIVVLVYSAERDTRLMARLINQGQIYRFISRPAGPDYLRLTMRAAMAHHATLVRRPQMAARHQPDVSDDDDFEMDLKYAARKPEARSASGTQPPARTISAARSWLTSLFR